MSKDITPEEQEKISKAWHRFLLDTAEADFEHGEPDGWHWFWGLYYLYNQPDEPYESEIFNIELIQKELPERHWLKKIGKAEWKAIDVCKDDKNLLDPMYVLLDNLENAARFPINFSGLTFKYRTTFSNLIFPVDANFSNTVFLGEALFPNTIFIRTANFENAKFYGKTAKFRAAVFNRVADFSGTVFENYANFKDSIFKGRVIFQRATFKIHAPRFYEAKLNKEIIWNKIDWPKFPNIFWASWQYFLKMIGNKHAKTGHLDIIRNNQNAYEDLAYQMEDLNKYHDQHLFFRNEMYCRRRLERFFTRPFYWFYEIFSNYGYGIGRSFGFWLGNICFWAGILFFSISYEKTTANKNLACSFFTSLSNAHSFFLSKSDRLTNCSVMEKDKFIFDAIWAIETIFGAMFFFLLLLTLRIRFRLK